jgi:Calcineurin-like phosphoesterase
MPFYDHTDNRMTRSLDEVKGVPRSRALSLWRTAKEEVALSRTERQLEYVSSTAGAPPGHDAYDDEPRRERKQPGFLRAAITKWITEYATHVFKGRRALPKFDLKKTRYVIPPKVKIALAADWGTGTKSAYAVGDEISARNPDVTIHLGDVYYSGTAKEYRTYFLDPRYWPRGALGTFVLNGNHEMYSGGEGYFEEALPELHQQTSFFCLENDFWRIVAVDSGYHSTRGIRRLFGDSTKLDPVNVTWLQQIFDESTKPVILLSHHQLFSAFEGGYPKLGNQLEPFLDKVHLWIWGHEHKLAGYQAYAADGKTMVRARCIGHGGMPIELGWKRTRPEPVVFSDERFSNRIVRRSRLGYCGFAWLEFDGPTLTITYIDELGTELLEEEWRITAEGLRGNARLLLSDSNIHIYRNLNSLVR